MNNALHVITAIASLFNTCFIRARQEAGFPAPDDNPNQLFYLQRTPVYELNYKNGKLDTSEPVHVFWIRYSDRGQRTELSSLQRKFAYGIKAKALSAEVFELKFISTKSRVMYLKKGPGEKYYVNTLINQKQAILTRVYLNIKGGSFWYPKIEYVDLKGTDPASSLGTSERVKLTEK